MKLSSFISITAVNEVKHERREHHRKEDNFIILFISHVGSSMKDSHS